MEACIRNLRPGDSIRVLKDAQPGVFLGTVPCDQIYPDMVYRHNLRHNLLLWKMQYASYVWYYTYEEVRQLANYIEKREEE